MSGRLILSPPDEYFNHQFALPHQVVASSDPNWRERYWVSIFDTVAQDTVLSLGFGKYPNRDVMDGFAILARGGVQRNLRAARQLLPDNSRTFAGPLRAEVLTPLESLRFCLEDSEADFAFDITWQGSVPPALEGRHFEVSRARITHDIARYVQTGQVRGELRVGEERIALDPERWWGVRDHSWGIRPMSPQPGDPPLESATWNFLAFIPMRFPSFSIHIYLFESQPGRPTHLTAAVMRPPGGGEHDDEIRTVDHEFTWVRDSPVQTLEGGTIRIGFFSGETMEITVRACGGRAFLSGGGYGSFQGKWKGEHHVEHDLFDLADTERMRDYNSHASDHQIEVTCGTETGFGIIEYLVRRGYGKYGEVHRRR